MFEGRACASPLPPSLLAPTTAAAIPHLRGPPKPTRSRRQPLLFFSSCLPLFLSLITFHPHPTPLLPYHQFDFFLIAVASGVVSSTQERRRLINRHRVPVCLWCDPLARGVAEPSLPPKSSGLEDNYFPATRGSIFTLSESQCTTLTAGWYPRPTPV